MIKNLANFGLFLFFAFTLLLTIAYTVAVYEKITKPTFKNLPTHQFVFLGLVIVLFLVIDFFILKRLLKRKR